MGGFKFTSEEVPKVKSLVEAPDYLSQANETKRQRLSTASPSYNKLSRADQVSFIIQLDERLRTRKPKPAAAVPPPAPSTSLTGQKLYDATTAKADAESKAFHQAQATPPPAPTSERWISSAASAVRGLMPTPGPPPVPKPPTISKESLDAEAKQIDPLEAQVKQLGQEIDSDKTKLSPENDKLKKSWDFISKESKEIDEEHQKVKDVEGWLQTHDAVINAHQQAGTATQEEIDQYNVAVQEHKAAVDSLNERIDAFRQKNSARNESILKLKGVDEALKQKVNTFNDTLAKYYLAVAAYNEKAKTLRGGGGEPPVEPYAAEKAYQFGAGGEFAAMAPAGAALVEQVKKRWGSILTPDEIEAVEKGLAIDPQRVEEIAQEREKEPDKEIPMMGFGEGGMAGGYSTGKERAEAERGLGTVARASIESLSQWYSPSMLLLQAFGRVGGKGEEAYARLLGNYQVEGMKAITVLKEARKLEKAGDVEGAKVLWDQFDKILADAPAQAKVLKQFGKLVQTIRAVNVATAGYFSVDYAARGIKDLREHNYTDAAADAAGFLGSLAFAGTGLTQMIKTHQLHIGEGPALEPKGTPKLITGKVGAERPPIYISPTEAPKPAERGTKPPPTPSAQPQTPAKPSPRPILKPPAPVAEPAAETGKEPFEMTWPEYLKHRLAVEGYQAIPREWGDGSSQRAQYQEAVEQAIVEGEDVPKNVLAQYPGIEDKAVGRKEYAEAVILAKDSGGKITVSGIQRKLKTSYEYAQRLMGRLREDGHLTSAATPPPEPSAGLRKPPEAAAPPSVPPNLPVDLAGSKPRYGYRDHNFELKFDDPRDLALYTVAQEKPNKAHDRFMTFLRGTFPGESDDQIIARGKAVRERIKGIASSAPLGDHVLLVPQAPQESGAIAANKGGPEVTPPPASIPTPQAAVTPPERRQKGRLNYKAMDTPELQAEVTRMTAKQRTSEGLTPREQRLLAEGKKELDAREAAEPAAPTPPPTLSEQPTTYVPQDFIKAKAVLFHAPEGLVTATVRSVSADDKSATIKLNKQARAITVPVGSISPAWVMTRDEYLAAGGDDMTHADAVSRAVDAGLKVPDEVLADYPELKGATPPPAATAVEPPKPSAVLHEPSEPPTSKSVSQTNLDKTGEKVIGTFTGGRVVDSSTADRIQVFFPSKPPATTRAALKKAGFRWAPSEGAWQAYRHEHTKQAAMRISGAKAPEAEEGVAVPPPEPSTGITWTKAAIIPTRAGVVAVPIEETAAPAAPKASEKMTRDELRAAIRNKLKNPGGTPPSGPAMMAAPRPKIDFGLMRMVQQFGKMVFVDDGVTDHTAWVAKMVEELGEESRPYLPPTWDHVNMEFGDEEAQDGRIGEEDTGLLAGESPASLPTPQPRGEITGVGGGSGHGYEGGGSEGVVAGSGPGVGVGSDVAGVDVPPERGRGEGGGTGQSNLTQKASDQQGINYRITADDFKGQGGEKTRYANNVRAIKTLKRIEAEGRLATPEEQSILVKYIGWGGLANAFKYWGGDEWKKTYDELKTLLTEEEFDDARASTQYAHYTAPEVIKPVWSALARLGFKGGKAMESAVGVGHFLGLQPVDLADRTQWVAIDKDLISARITRQLYQRADLHAKGFEEVFLPNNWFDVEVTNVPFAKTSPHDPDYNALKLNLHNYFIVKNLDKLRPGGVAAFITSHYTMDSVNPAARREMAKRADLIAAIRLPKTAFEEFAKTEVVTDILFFQKRAKDVAYGGKPFVEASGELVDTKHSWVKPAKYSEYYVEHPEMILGKPTMGGTMYGRGEEMTVEPDGRDLSTALDNAVKSLPEGIYRTATKAPRPAEAIEQLKPGDKPIPDAIFVEGGKAFQYVQDAEGNYGKKALKLDGRTMAQLNGVLEIRDTVRSLWAKELQGDLDEAANERIRLNNLYDAFRAKFGSVTNRVVAGVMSRDPSFPLLKALEKVDAEGKIEKTDVFTKATIAAQPPPETASNPEDGMMISMNQKGFIDWDYVEKLTSRSKLQMQQELAQERLIFKNPEADWELADDYLSGNVRQKLRAAEAAAKLDPSYQSNVDALKSVQPEEVPAGEVKAKVGSSWIPPQYFTDFMVDKLGIPNRLATCSYIPVNAQWLIDSQAFKIDNAQARTQFGNKDYNSAQLLFLAMNLKAPVVYDEDENGNEFKDEKRTKAAEQKMYEIKQAFEEWVWTDPERAKTLVGLYNEKFNSIRLWEPDGSYLTFPGLALGYEFRPVQKNFIARVIRRGRGYAAHEVGIGKTWVYIGAAMELKRLGLARKPIIAVTKSTIGQYRDWAAKLYPNSNAWITTKDDFEASKRKELMSRIATGNWDFVVVTHDQLKMLPIKAETFNRFVQEEIDSFREFLERNRGDLGRRSVKQLEKQIENLEIKLREEGAQEGRDRTLTFEETGCDYILFDEAHVVKKLSFQSKLQVPGVGAGKGSDIAFDVYVKSRGIMERNNGRGLVLASGTPITNTLSEMFNIFRFLAPEILKEWGCQHFDSWVSNFAVAQRVFESSPEDPTKMRVNTRLVQFINVAELVRNFRSFVDVQTAADNGITVPESERFIHPIDISPTQKAYVRELGDRAEVIRSRNFDPTQDNMPLVCTDGRKCAVDSRLVDPDAEFDPNSKIPVAAREIARIYKATEEIKGTQLVCLDFSTPAAIKKGGYNAYQDMTDELVKNGVKREDIAWIHDYESEEEKSGLCQAMNDGEIRILLGSTKKAGTGLNIQIRMTDIHHLDAVFRPDEFIQREGRGVRFGNMNKKIGLHNWTTKESFDAYMYQMVERKAKMIQTALSKGTNLREIDDLDSGNIPYGDIKAITTGNPMVMEKLKIDSDVERLQMQKDFYHVEQGNIRFQLVTLPGEIQAAEGGLAKRTADNEAYKKIKEAPFEMWVGGNKYGERKAAGDALASALKPHLGQDWEGKVAEWGSSRSWELRAQTTTYKTVGYEMDENGKDHKIEKVTPVVYLHLITPKGTPLSISWNQGTDPQTPIRSIDSQGSYLDAEIKRITEAIANKKKSLTDYQQMIGKPFKYQTKLDEAKKRQQELEDILNPPKNPPAEAPPGPAKYEVDAPDAREIRRRMPILEKFPAEGLVAEWARARDNWDHISDVGEDFALYNEYGGVPDYVVDGITSDPNWKALGAEIANIAQEVKKVFLPDAGPISRAGVYIPTVHALIDKLDFGVNLADPYRTNSYGVFVNPMAVIQAVRDYPGEYPFETDEEKAAYVLQIIMHEVGHNLDRSHDKGHEALLKHMLSSRDTDEGRERYKDWVKRLATVIRGGENNGGKFLRETLESYDEARREARGASLPVRGSGPVEERLSTGESHQRELRPDNERTAPGGDESKTAVAGGTGIVDYSGVNELPNAAVEPPTPTSRPLLPPYVSAGLHEARMSRVAPGPGAKTAGPPETKGTPLKQLTESIESLEEPRGFKQPPVPAPPVPDIDTGAVAGGALASIRDLVTKAWELYASPPPTGDFMDAIGKFQGNLQRSSDELRKYVAEMVKKFPNKERREAMTNWVQAKGENDTLTRWASLSKGSVKKAYLIATALTNEESTAANNIRNMFDSYWDIAHKAGVLEGFVENYIPQLRKQGSKFTSQTVASVASGILRTDFRFAKKRVFETYFEGEQSGFPALDKDIGFLVTAYIRALNKAIEGRGLVRNLLAMHAKDGRALATTSGHGWPVKDNDADSRANFVSPNTKPEEATDYRSVSHPAMRRWLWATKDDNGNPIFVQGDVIVHPEIYKHLRNILGTSAFRAPDAEWYMKAGRMVLSGSTFAKQTFLGPFATFHQVQVGMHALMHRVQPFSPPVIDHTNTDQRGLVDGGLLIADPDGSVSFEEGLVAGGLWNAIPWAGTWLRWYKDFLFQSYIPRLKMSMGLAALSRNRERYGSKLTAAQLYRLSASQGNAAFGEQNYLMMGRNKTMQDALRLILLSPDFTESRARFVGQAAKPYGREQLVALSIGAGLLVVLAYSAYKLISAAMPGEKVSWDWHNPFSVRVGKYEFDTRSIQGDIMGLFKDWGQFMEARLNPATVKPALEAIRGRDSRGMPRTFKEQVKDYFFGLVPISFQGLTAPERHLWESALGAFGIRARKFYSPAGRLALQYHMENIASKPRRHETEETLSDRQAVSKLFQSLNDGVKPTEEEIHKLEVEGRISLYTAHRLRDAQPGEDPFLNLFSSLGIEDKLDVWDKANSEERIELFKELRMTRADVRMLHGMPKIEREAVIRRYRRAQQEEESGVVNVTPSSPSATPPPEPSVLMPIPPPVPQGGV